MKVGACGRTSLKKLLFLICWTERGWLWTLEQDRVAGVYRIGENEMRPRKTILCVDDNEQVLSVRKFLLETRGYRVLGMTTAAEALEYLQEVTEGAVDLLLADLILPQMDGNELIRRAKQVHPGLPTLLVSGTVANFDRAASADAFLPKGACTPAEVLDRIRILVARKRGPKKRVQSVTVEAASGAQTALAS